MVGCYAAAGPVTAALCSYAAKARHIQYPLLRRQPYNVLVSRGSADHRLGCGAAQICQQGSWDAARSLAEPRHDGNRTCRFTSE
ncbi:hypothetical protein GY45DRAFT_1327356 [Cubamyces sp. BRFM 1775]|nr:hypothetical protein GY45DRAFT_1327356 [Cubamyces sp. BRFM 1775]